MKTKEILLQFKQGSNQEINDKDKKTVFNRWMHLKYKNSSG